MAKGSKNTLSKVAFFTIIISAIVYLTNTLLQRLGVSFSYNLLQMLQNLAEAVIFIVGTILGWSYASKKSAAWKVAYIVCTLVILICIVLPLLPI